MNPNIKLLSGVSKEKLMTIMIKGKRNDQNWIIK